MTTTCLSSCLEPRAGKGGRSPSPNHLTIHFLKRSNLDKTLIGGGGGYEVKRDNTLRKLWIDHEHNAGNCSLEALEFSIFLGCYLPTTPPPPKSGVCLRPCNYSIVSCEIWEIHALMSCTRPSDSCNFAHF